MPYADTALSWRGISTHLYRLSSVMENPRKAPSSRTADTHMASGVSCTKTSCQAISKYQPICHPKPAGVRRCVK